MESGADLRFLIVSEMDENGRSTCFRKVADIDSGTRVGQNEMLKIVWIWEDDLDFVLLRKADVVQVLLNSNEAGNEE
jgi:hypothetical protein